MQIEQLETMMEQVGPVLDPFQLTYFPKSRVWDVQLDAEIALLIDGLVEDGKLVLSCDLGAPPHGDRRRLYEIMLMYNYTWHETGGGRLALDGPEGNVALILDLALSEFDARKLAGVVQTFGQAARAWREIVARAGAKPDSEVPPPVGADMIRI